MRSANANDGADRSNVSGVLCLHGFSGTPFEVRFLADSLHERGFVVRTPMLPGHGTSADELNRTTRSEWKAAVASEVDELCAQCANVAIVGQSMGGLLALERASHDERICAVVALATPLWLGGLSQWLVRGLARLPRTAVRRLPHRSKGGGSDVRDQEIRAQNPSYPVLPLAGVVELSELMAEVHARLAHLTCPLLVIHGRQDHTAPVDCAPEIIRRVASDDRSMMILPESYHLIACDVEREHVAERTGQFLARVSGKL